MKEERALLSLQKVCMPARAPVKGLIISRRRCRRAGHRTRWSKIEKKGKMGGGAEATCAVDVTEAVGVRGGGGKWFRVSDSKTLNLGLVGFGLLFRG
ncbi:hypothetical protein V6Z11_A10G220100 [Gossypium hirsutum]